MFRKKPLPPPTRRKPSVQTGSSPVFSYYSSRNPADNPARQNREASIRRWKLRRLWRYTPSLIAAGALLACVGYTLTLSTSPKLTILASQPNPLLRPTAAYQEAASRQLASSIFNRSKLTINTTKTAEQLRRQFPEFADVSITIPLLGQRPIIEVEPAVAALLLVNQKGVFVIDQAGRVLLPARDAPSASQTGLPRVTDTVTSEDRPGATVLPADTVKFIQQLGAQFAAKKLTSQSMELPPVASELHVRFQGLPYYVKFNLSSDVRQQVGTLFAVQNRLAAEQVTPAEYIDVRVEERAYYK